VHTFLGVDSSQLSGVVGCSSAVVAVSNDGVGHLQKFVLKETVFGRIHFPHAMLYLDVREVLQLLNVVVGFSGRGNMLNLLLNCSVVVTAVGEANGAGVGTQGVSETCPVLFFFEDGLLGLADEVVLVVTYAARTHEAELLLAQVLLRVDVVARLGVLLHPPELNEVVQIVLGCLVYKIRIAVCVLRQVDFSSLDVQEGLGVPVGNGSGFRGIKHVVRAANDFLDEVLAGEMASKG